MTGRCWQSGPIAAAALVAVLGLSACGALEPSAGATAADDGRVPTVHVVRGELVKTVTTKGELRAARQLPLQAPAVGGSLYILDILDTGTVVDVGDVLVTFDPSEQQFQLEQALSELAEAEQEILKRRADALVQEAESQVALLAAEFDVRRAGLDARIDADLIAAAEYRIRQVSLEEAERRLAQLREDIASRSETSEAAMTVLEERRDKASVAADRARENIEKLVLRAPIGGVVSIRENLSAVSGGIIGPGMIPPFRVGDFTSAGRPVVDVFDLSGMEIRAPVNEQERDNVMVGYEALVTPDTLAGAALTARVTAVSGLGRAAPTTGPLRLFDVTLELDQPDARLAPGTSVEVVINGSVETDQRLVPRQALFERDGKSVVYVRGPAGFTTVEVGILHRNETLVAIDGIEEGTEVALVDPNAAGVTTATAPAVPPAGGARP